MPDTADMHSEQDRWRGLLMVGPGEWTVGQIRRLLALYTVLSAAAALLSLIGPRTQGWTTLAVLTLTGLPLTWGFVGWPGMALAQAATAAAARDLLRVQTLWGPRQINLAELRRVRHLKISGRDGSQAFLMLIDRSGRRVVLSDANFRRACYGKSEVVDEAVRVAVLHGMQSGDVVISPRARRALAAYDSRFGRLQMLPGSAIRDSIVTLAVGAAIPLTLLGLIAAIYPAATSRS